MSYTIIRPKNHEEWLQYRTGGIGSSEVGTILGLNKYETPYQLWRRKIGIDPPKAENNAMKAGHYLEPAVAQFFVDATGAKVIKASAGDWLMVNDDKPHMRVSPDRLYWADGDKHSAANKRILECKTTRMKVDEENIPYTWICQLTYQLGVAELERGALAWLTQGQDFGYKDIYFDKEFFAYITEEVERFWVDNILGKQEPAAINAEDILLKSPLHTEGKEIIADLDTLNRLSLVKKLKEEIEELEASRNDVINDLKLTIGDAESLVDSNGTLITWKAPKPTNKFDEKRFKQEHPDLYEQYQTKVQGARRFLIK